MDWNKTNVNISELKGSSVMKKILFFVDNFDEGGVSKVLLDLLENINLDKYQITVMALYGGGIYQKRFEQFARIKHCFIIPDANDQTLKTNLYRKYWGGMLRLPEKLFYKWFIRENYDVEVAFFHGWSTKIIGGSLNKKSKKIAWVHTDLVNWNAADGVFKNLNHHKKTYEKYQRVISVSHNVQNGMKQKYGLEGCEVLYNPINKTKILTQAKETVDYKPLPNTINLITVGRLSYEKGYDRLITACHQLNVDQLNFQLIIIGEGPERKKLEELIQQFNLKDKVKLLGQQDNPYKYLKLSDLFICSSRGEGFGLVVAEAMTLGIPVVTVDCAGPRELSNNGEYALLVDNSEEELYKGIKQLILDKELRFQYQERSLIGANQFSLEKFIKQVESILDID